MARKTQHPKGNESMLTKTAETVLKKRYYIANEDWPELCERVGETVGADPLEQAEFANLIYSLDFLPNSPCLMNAGTELNQLSACVSGRSPVYTRRGVVQMKDIVVGDEVLTHLGRFRRVTAHWSNGIRKTMSFSRGRRNRVKSNVEFTADHKILGVDDRWHPALGIEFVGAKVPSFVSTDYRDRFELVNYASSISKTPEISDNGDVIRFLNRDKQQRSGRYCDQLGVTKAVIKVDHRIARFFGSFLANGNLDGGAIRMCANSNKREMLARYCKDIFAFSGKDPSIEYSNHGNWVTVRVHSKLLASFLRAEFGNGSSKKQVPDWVFNLETASKIAFLEGMQDDFHIRKSGSATAQLANPTLSYQILLLARSVGRKGNIIFDAKNKLSKQPTSKLFLSETPDIENTLSFVGAEVEVFDMEVEDDHSFVVGDMIAHNCFVLPVEDSMEDIFGAIRNGALIHKSGGGTGYSFSRLRAKNAPVSSTKGIASGPLSFMQVFDAATETIKQGGKRRGANMAVLRVDHPDIMDFIGAKSEDGAFSNFNFSVALTDEFMEAVEADNIDGATYYPLRDPEQGIVGALNAPEVFDEIVRNAHANGEPGVLFIDAANRANPTPHLGDYEATNPCGELYLLPYESCNLGSINLSRFVKSDGIDYPRLRKVTHAAVRFLDAVIDVTSFPIPEIEEATKKTRKIGLGIMGLHDMLIQVGFPYDSAEGRHVAESVMEFIWKEAEEMSFHLAFIESRYPGQFAGEMLDCTLRGQRNATLTSIQPTGTVSMIADCSSGCEPYFAIVARKNVLDGESFLMVNKHFERIARDEGFYSDELMERVASSGTVVGHDEIPEEYQQLFKTAQDISPEDHILMQGALQSHGVDSSISKTINMPATATAEDVKKAYLMAWELGCKGLTIYRDGSRSAQPLTAGATKVEGTRSAAWPVKNPLADVLDAKRYRLTGENNETIYITVCNDDAGNPVEVFAKFPYENHAELQGKSTMWTTTCRLVSLLLRYGVPVEEVIKQLDRSSGNMLDLPAQLCKLLKNGSEYSEPCPECHGGTLVFAEGCSVCKTCGYSKCS
jgi:ribonucleoside-diphosphate reductase alpha chain